MFPPGGGNFFLAPDNKTRLYFEAWSSSGSSEAKANVIFLPGVHESADTVKARRLAEGFVSHGFNFLCLEHFGHGRSCPEGHPLGLVSDYGLLLNHVRWFVDTVGRWSDLVVCGGRCCAVLSVLHQAPR